MIKRTIENLILKYLQKFPVVTLTGVRQCGKSTILKELLKNYTYVSLEDPDTRDFAEFAPRDFLKKYDNHCIFDEIQRVPNLFSYIQTKVDSKKEMGQYILSGSHNFNLMKNISQSLAGRTAVLTLAPFSIAELDSEKLLPDKLDDILFNGFYPPIYDREISPQDYFPSYLDTYIERDVRLLQNISNATAFKRFIKLLAIHSGQPINFTELSNESGVSVPTVKSWISILIQSYLIYELPPYHKNISKRLVKSPKIYFYDTGLLCHLLGIENKENLRVNDKFGYIFETMVISEFKKNKLFNGKNADGYFYRDTNQLEVDLLDERGTELYAYEIKSTEVIDKKYFKNLLKVSEILQIPRNNLMCIYTGNNTIKNSEYNFTNYKNAFLAK